MRKILVSIIFVLFIALGVLGGLNAISPTPLPQNPGEDFNNVISDVAAIAAVPHPAGSEENRAVRDMIINRAETFGLAAEVLPFEFPIEDALQSDLEYYEENVVWRERKTREMELAGYSNIEDYFRYMLGAPQGVDTLALDNVLVKVSGTAAQGAVMFVAHYDSVITAPGAADDGLAVANMLCLMQQLSKAPPQNDVYFLFTDGEERGLLGAADFVRTQPQYADEIDIILNFEGRGNSGALLMFETSGSDYELVQNYAANVPKAVSFSPATAIYGMMPNGTDYTEFKNTGYYGLNFAMIEGSETYHQPTDTPENLNKNTAWHYYQTMQGLAEHFANINIGDIQNDQEAVYFPLPFVGVVVIPGWLGTILGFVPLALAVLLIFLTIRNKDLKRVRKIIRITGLALLGILPAALTLFLFAFSYLISIPAILFLVADLVMGKKVRIIPGLIALEVAVLLAALIFTPLAVLIYVALGMWYATAIMVALPLIPTVLYGVKILRRV